ncbi:MAG: PAS domain S-box protein, partial [Bacteroidota bacterium]
MEVTMQPEKTATDEHFTLNLNPIRKRGSNVISGVCLRIKDITNEKQNIEAIQKQKVFYETILDNIPADIGIFSKDHRYLYVNPAGIKDKNLRQWMIGKTDYDYCEFRKIDSRIADERSELFKDVLDSGKEKEIESYHIANDGSTKHMLRKFYPVYENGEFKLMIGYGVNVTQLKESQGKLKENENRYRALFESNPLPVLVIDLNGIVISTNNALLKETGHNPSDIIGQHIGALLSDKGKNAFPDWFSAYVQDPETVYQREIKVRNAKGTLLDFEITIEKIDFDQDKSQILIVANNITERKKNARLLEESERLNRRLLQELPVSVATIVEGRLTHTNNAFYEMLGYEPLEVIEKPFVDFVLEDDRYIVEKYNFELFTGTDTVEYRIRMKAKSGELRSVDIRETLFDLKSNMVTLALISDVTEKVAIENKNKEIEERTKLIIESALDGIVLTDSQLRIVDWNSKSAEMFQWSNRLLSGVELNQFFEINTKENILREGLFETSGMRSNGLVFPAEIFTARLVAGDKDLFVFYIRDITERVEVMKQMRDAERVEHILNQYNAEIYQLDNQVDVFNRMISTFHSICDLCHITVFSVDENGNALNRIEGVGESFRLPIWNDTMLIPSQHYEIVEQAKASCNMVIRTGVDNGMEKSDLAIPITINNQTFAIMRFETGFTGLFSDGNQGIIRKMMEAT